MCDKYVSLMSAYNDLVVVKTIRRKVITIHRLCNCCQLDTGKSIEYFRDTQL